MMKMKLQLARFDKDGRLVELREQESRSWLKHLFDILYGSFASLTLAGVTDVLGNVRTLAAVSGGTGVISHGLVASPGGQSGLAVSTYVSAQSQRILTITKGEDVGIVVGIDAGGPHAVTPLDNALVTKVNHGETAGKLLYGGTELYGLTFANPNGQFTIRRYFTNVLGGNISVAEVGIQAVGITDPLNGYAGWPFCIARDVVAIPVVVANGEILRVTYVPAITV